MSEEVLDCVNAKFVGKTRSGLNLYECPLHELRVTPEALLCKACKWRKTKLPEKGV